MILTIIHAYLILFIRPNFVISEKYATVIFKFESPAHLLFIFKNVDYYVVSKTMHRKRAMVSIHPFTTKLLP